MTFTRQKAAAPDEQVAESSTYTLTTAAGESIICREVVYLDHPFLYPETSDVGAALARGWEWDHVLRPIVDTLLPSSRPTICEVGSNIGASVLEMLAVRPAARITCYEPSDRYRTVLDHNLAAAGYGDADVTVRAAVADRDAGQRHIYTDDTSGSIRPLDHLTRAQEAAAVRLDDEFADRDEPLQFLKCDTDGHDIEVLRGAHDILVQDQPVLFIELCPALMTSDPIADLQWLQGLGYMQLVCLDHLGFHVGTTTDAAQAVQWSRERTYCDILTAAVGTDAADRVAFVPLSPPPPPAPPPARSLPRRLASRVVRKLRLRSAVGRHSGFGELSTEAAELFQARYLSKVDVRRHNAGGVAPTFPNLQSQAPSAAQCDSPEYLELAARLQNWTGPPTGEQYQRKLWEWVYILQAIVEAGRMRPGATAVGFGVGSEPIPAYLAAEGISVLATDQGLGGTTGGEWVVGDQLLRGLSSLSRPYLIDDDRLAERVRVRDVDMNHVPRDIGTFDIVWSSCVIEHLGSPRHGMDFVIESCKLLNPGGVAVHTTELELTEQPTTRDYGHCAVYRIDDVLELERRLADIGCSMSANFTIAMETFEDRWLSLAGHPDYAPLLPDRGAHLKLVLGNSVSTSFGILIRKD